LKQATAAAAAITILLGISFLSIFYFKWKIIVCEDIVAFHFNAHAIDE
jgi:hypothetical protein